jgi:outer membrane protein assembly factor BamC
MKQRCISLALVALAAVAVSGCETLDEKRKIDYKAVKSLPPLEVPPDLGAPPAMESAGRTAPAGAATYSDYAAEQKVKPAVEKAQTSTVVPEFPDMRLARDGQTRWLVVKTDPETLWPRVREFVQANGMLIDKQNAETGILETDWAENRANVGTAGQRMLAKWLSSIYSTGLRDKYRIRLDRGGEPGTTEIYVSHQGMEEVIVEGGGTNPTRTMWQPRAADPELEAEMLRLLMVHLGNKQAQDVIQAAAGDAARIERARLTRGDTGAQLSLQDSLDRAWRRVGLSLDRLGFTVEDRDRSKGVYYVRYLDPDQEKKKSGWFSGWFGGDDTKQKQQYQIQLRGREAGTDVAVLDKDGAPETSKTGDRILGLLYDQLK